MDNELSLDKINIEVKLPLEKILIDFTKKLDSSQEEIKNNIFNILKSIVKDDNISFFGHKTNYFCKCSVFVFLIKNLKLYSQTIFDQINKTSCNFITFSYINNYVMISM